MQVSDRFRVFPGCRVCQTGLRVRGLGLGSASVCVMCSNGQRWCHSVHVVLDLCEEPHPRITVPPGTICDYDMEKGLLCK